MYRHLMTQNLGYVGAGCRIKTHVIIFSLCHKYSVYFPHVFSSICEYLPIIFWRAVSYTHLDVYKRQVYWMCG